MFTSIGPNSNLFILRCQHSPSCSKLHRCVTFGSVCSASVYSVRPNLWVLRVECLGPVPSARQGTDNASQLILLSVVTLGTDSATMTKVKVGFSVNYVYVLATTTHDWQPLMLAIKTVQT